MLKCAVSFFRPCLFFNYDCFWLWMQLGQSYMQEYLARMTYPADGAIVTARFQMIVDCVHAEGQIPGFQTSLQNFM